MKINTRNMREEDLYSKSDSVQIEQSQGKVRSTALSDREAEEDINDDVLERFSSPTFNIHIHVPYYDSKNSELILPKIQPIINLHFDELARKLDSNRHKKNKKSLYKTFQNLLKNISPKFGVVKFHIKNSSDKRDVQEIDIINETPNSSKKHNNDMGLNKNKSSEKAQNVVTKNCETTTINNCENKTKNSNNNCNHYAPTSYELYKDIKLKKAIVVLTDICKSKNYKHFFERSKSCKNENNENEFSCNFEEKLENNCSGEHKCEAQIFSLKAENESYAPESFTTEWNKDNFDVSENHFVDTDLNLHIEKDINLKSHIEKICNRKDQNFTALVEGWNFSDILKRFQSKHREELDNFVASSNGIIENRSDNCEMDDDNNEPSHKLSKEIKESKCIEKENLENESYNDDKLDIKINKAEIDSNEKGFFDENKSDIVESFSFLQYQNETKKELFMRELDIFNEDSTCEFNKVTKEDIESKFASNLDNSGSDECEIISGKEVSSRGIVDMEVVKHDLSSIRSNAVAENNFEVPETNKSSLSYITSPKFHLKLIKKEMQRRNLTVDKVQQNSKSMKSDVESSPSESTPSPKKMKLTNRKPEISKQKTKKSLKADDYIRLNSSGPTEFFVTSLNKVKPSTPAVKDFKRKMLFDSRVNRFSSSKLLRIYQLKKDAAKKSVK